MEAVYNSPEASKMSDACDDRSLIRNFLSIRTHLNNTLNHTFANLMECHSQLHPFVDSAKVKSCFMQTDKAGEFATWRMERRFNTNLIAMASNLIARASILVGMASIVVAMASNRIAYGVWWCRFKHSFCILFLFCLARVRLG